MIKEIKNLFIITVDYVKNCMLWSYIFVVFQALWKTACPNITSL